MMRKIQKIPYPRENTWRRSFYYHGNKRFLGCKFHGKVVFATYLPPTKLKTYKKQEKGLNTLNSVNPFFYNVFSKIVTASVCIISVLNVYVCNVVEISLCPNLSMTVLGLTPFSASIVPCVCRRQ